jgi:predicted 2-oxoglutarate/Fe(II)-dependent dioxygenase YbiX/peroxiredoxin
MLSPGDPAPWFTAASTVNPLFQFHTAAGRYVALSFFGSAASPAGRRVIDDALRSSARFDVQNACFLGVSTDTDDERLNRVGSRHQGIVFFWDFDQSISRLYGAAAPQGKTDPFRPHTLVLDPCLRVLAALPIEGDGADHVPRLLAILSGQPLIATLQSFAPVIIVPRVFTPEFCRTLIDLYNQHGGRDSGFMRDIDGKTVALTDHRFKRREDYYITDQSVSRAAQALVRRRLVPEMWKAFQFRATRIERHLVCCYDAAMGGQFQPHRDNTTKGTSHRRFAVTINLNDEEYEGGDLRFPEYGPRTYRAPTGGAVAFSCSLLHEATVVTRGRRIAYLPFLYDEAAEKIRGVNLKFLGNPSAAGPIVGARSGDESPPGRNSD